MFLFNKKEISESGLIRKNGNERNDSIIGSLIGGAIGDALGYQIEFKKILEIRKLLNIKMIMV